MLRILALLSLGALAFGAAHAQVWEEWMRLHRGSGANAAFDAALDPRENILVLGDDPHSGTDRAMVIKYSPAGDVLWMQTYRAPNQRYTAPREIRAHRDGTFVISTHTEGYDDNVFFELVKYDNDGNRLWVYRYDKPGTLDEYQRMDMDAHGNVYVAGVWHVFDVQRDRQGFVIKVSPEGQLVWETALEYDSPWSIPANRIAVSPDGGTIGVAGTVFLGYTHDRYALGNDALVWRLDSTGAIVANIRLSATHEGARRMSASHIAVYNNAIVACGGASTRWDVYTSTGAHAPWIASVAADRIEWRHDLDYYNRNGQGSLRTTICRNDGSIVAYGGVGPVQSVFEMYPIYSFCVAPNGSFLWDHYLWLQGYGLHPVKSSIDFNGKRYIAGAAYVAQPVNYLDIYAAKYNATNDIEWAYHYNGPADNYDNLSQMRLDSRGGVYLVGSTVWDWSSLSDWITLKLCQRWGDADNDGRVDATDLEIVLERFGQSAAPGRDGDVTEDGFVDDADLALVLWMFGTTCP